MWRPILRYGLILLSLAAMMVLADRVSFRTPVAGDKATLTDLSGSRGIVAPPAHGDPIPWDRDPDYVPAPERNVSRASTMATCSGDGISGPRVQVLYVRSSTVGSQLSTYRSSFQQWANETSQVFENSAQKTGQHRYLRFVHDSLCAVKVTEVVLSTLVYDYAHWESLQDELIRLGYARGDRKYLVFLDEADKYACGWGTPQSDDSPGSSNLNNSVAGWAVIFRTCWNDTQGSTPHEISHALGAVQDSAPNSSLGWHCIDQNDIMCYSDSPYYPPMRTDCPDAAAWALLDCDNDDYFNPNPVAGSYLATHWNTANSIFVGRGLGSPYVTTTPTRTATRTPTRTPTKTRTPNAATKTAARIRTATAARVATLTARSKTATAIRGATQTALRAPTMTSQARTKTAVRAATVTSQALTKTAVHIATLTAAANVTMTANAVATATAIVQATVAAEQTATEFAAQETATALAATPTLPNDPFEGSINVDTLPYYAVVDAQLATSAESDPESCQFFLGNTLWYTLVVAQSGHYQVDTYDSEFDTVVAIYSGTPPNLTMVGCNDEWESQIALAEVISPAGLKPQSAAFYQSGLVSWLVAGQTYYVMVGAYPETNAGNLSLRIMVYPNQADEGSNPAPVPPASMIPTETPTATQVPTDAPTATVVPTFTPTTVPPTLTPTTAATEPPGTVVPSGGSPGVGEG